MMMKKTGKAHLGVKSEIAAINSNRLPFPTIFWTYLQHLMDQILQIFFHQHHRTQLGKTSEISKHQWIDVIFIWFIQNSYLNSNSNSDWLAVTTSRVLLLNGECHLLLFHNHRTIHITKGAMYPLFTSSSWWALTATENHENYERGGFSFIFQIGWKNWDGWRW